MQPNNPPQGNLLDLGFEERLSKWLKEAGFEWNPFSEIDAKDEPHLGEYFIYPEGFGELLGKNSTVLYAPQGGGKTASRRMVEHSCAIGDEVLGKIFSVTYDNFEEVVERAERGLDSITARMHVEAILQNGLPLLFDHLFQNPTLVDGFEISVYSRALIKRFTDCLADFHINPALEGTGVNKQIIMEALAHDNLDGLLVNVGEDYHPRVRFIAALLQETTDEVSLDKLGPKKLLEEFYDLVKAAGFDTLFVLIDNVDGLPKTDGNPRACVELLSALVGTASLMSLPGVFFKLFLPLDTKPLLDRFRAFSTIRSVKVEWSDEKLRQVLQERLKAATQEVRPPITSLDAVSEAKLRGRIDSELIKYSKTPRDLMLLGREVFKAHIRQLPVKELITVEVIVQALSLSSSDGHEKEFTETSERKDSTVMATAQIFLCYAREDKEKVETLYQQLSDIGFNPWMDTKDILPGAKWKLEIQKAIRCSGFVLVCLSKNSVDKRSWVQREIRVALDILEEMLDSDIYLIPARLEDCEVPESLSDFQCVNLFEENGWTRLVQAIQVGMERRAEEKPAPEKPFPDAETASPDQGLEQVPEGMEQKIEHLKKLQARHSANICKLEETLAWYGMTPPLYLVNSLEYENEQLREVEARLTALREGKHG